MGFHLLGGSLFIFHRTPEVVCSFPLSAPLRTVRKSRASVSTYIQPNEPGRNSPLLTAKTELV